jgi:predicted permease
VSPTSLWRQVTRGFRSLLRRADADRDVSDEVQHYLEQATAAHAAQGLSPDDALRAARLEVGNATAVKEEVRDSGWESAIESFFADLRYAGRVLRKSPVFTLVTILVVSLGTGAVTTIFSATNAMLLRPLPGAGDASRLFGVERKHRNGTESMGASYGYYRQVRDNTNSFDGVAAWNDIELTITDGGTGTAAYGDIVSGNYFNVLRVHPALGRFFLPDEDETPLTHPVMVISYGFWKSRFGADSTVVGKTVLVNGHPFTIIGVAPAAFRGVYIPLKLDAWLPIMMEGQIWTGHDLSDPSDLAFRMFARLKDGATRAAARQEVTVLTATRIAAGIEPMPWAKNYVDVRLVPLSGLPEDATQAIVGFFLLLLGASALVLLIASVNVAAMLSARAVARRREMAVRAALGARRGRLIRQLLTESLLLFLLGAGGGIAIAVVATRALERLPLPNEISLDLAPDYRAIAFALVVALGTGIAFGLAPALQAARTDIAKRIREDSPSAGARRTVVGNALVVGQLALSLLLLVAAGLFLRALQRGNRIDPGFDSTGVSVAEINTEAFGYDSTRGRAFYRTLRERLEAIPGVTTVTATAVTPLTMSTTGTRIRLNGVDNASGAVDASDAGVRVGIAPVDPHYFEALKMPIVLGVPIDKKDDERSAKVVVVNETFARLLSPDGNAVGRTFTYDSSLVTVIGVARNAKYGSLTEPSMPFMFFPMAQHWMPRQVLLVRSNAAPDRMVIAIRRAVQAIDPGLPAPVVTTLREANSIVLLPQRVAAMVTGALGAIGLLMATVGLYGIVSYSVSRRGREIGIRVALGARQTDVLGMVVREGMQLALCGVAIGVVLAAAATRLMASFLFSVSPLDAMTFVGMSLLFLCVAFVSSYLPARRAATSDPMTALRTD